MAKAKEVDGLDSDAVPKMEGRSVEMFRTMFDPMITPTPRQAFVPSDLSFKALLTKYGIHCKMDRTGLEHLIPYDNIQSIRLTKIKD